MEFRGEAKGVAVYDDFAHHPTAIHATLEGARLAFPGSRIWGVFEPRSWSSRRNIFQNEFAGAFRAADFAVIAGVFEPDKVPAEIRLDPEKLVQDINQNGTPGRYILNREDLIHYIVGGSKPGDRIVLMSNGSFDNIHERLVDALKKKA
jgi:UDP-N-acetylmuramate: L-alanyl-gamma-D-glutamyl-meso-diaminopimelate ligase